MTATSGAPRRSGPGRWPAWLGALGWLIAVAGALAVSGVLTAVYVFVGGDAGHLPPALTALGTLAQSVILAAAAVSLAWRHGPPRPGDFGLRPASAPGAVAWTAAGALAVAALGAVYTALAGPPDAHDVAQSLGVDHGSRDSLAAAVVAIVIAPLAEEVLFRGLCYRALRNRFSVSVAGGVVAVAFASVHLGGRDTWSLMPLFALLGAGCCVLYERTGSLYPAIALHCLAASIALGSTLAASDRVSVSAACGLLALLACAVAPSLQRRAAARVG